MIAWIPGSAPSTAGNASTSAASPLRQSFGAAAAVIPSTPPSRAATAAGSSTLLDEHVERLQHARRDPGRPEGVAADDCIALSGDVLHLGLVRVQLKAVEDEHAGDQEPNCRNGYRPRVDESRPAPPRPVFGVTAVDQPLRQQAETVDPCAEHRQQRREQRDRREHRYRRDQHSADADRADERHRQDDQREQSDRDGRARDDHGLAGVRHRLDECRLHVSPLAQLVAEAEDHEQRVVDRDTEADERDQELHDDRHVRDVGEEPDEREGVENRGHGDRDRQQDRGQRSEDEEEDHERAEPADERLDEEARATRVAVLVRLHDRVVAGDVDFGARGQSALRRSEDCLGAALGVDVRRAGRVELHEGRVPVVRDVRGAACREERARPRAGTCLERSFHRRGNRFALGRVALGFEHDDVRRAIAGPEPIERPLVRLVGRVAGDRERLEPTLRHLGGGEAAEDGERQPGQDDGLAVVGGGVSEASEHGNSFSKDSPQDRLRAASPQSVVRRSLGRRKSAICIDFGRVFNSGRAAYA